MMRERLSADTYIQGILAGNHMLLSRAITVTESSLPEDQALAEEILSGILPHTGKSLRVGITGIPGVGKSTFIEALGQYLTSAGKKVAVLTVDPTSQKSGGSILGDKTRMEELSRNPRAYIRPSPNGLSLGGVAHSTRDTLHLCEAAGFDIVLIETVGVGQSETMVRGMTDFFLLLTIAGTGDEMQGIKRGIMELVDAVIVNKADGAGRKAALLAASEYKNALHLMRQPASGIAASVLTCSALHREGIAEVWQVVESHIVKSRASGYFEKNRQNQNVEAMHELAAHWLVKAFYEAKETQAAIGKLAEAVSDGRELPQRAARYLIGQFLSISQKP